MQGCFLQQGGVQNACKIHSEGLCPSDLGKRAYSLATHVGLQRAKALCRGLRSGAPSVDFAGVLGALGLAIRNVVRNEFVSSCELCSSAAGSAVAPQESGDFSSHR